MVSNLIRHVSSESKNINYGPQNIKSPIRGTTSAPTKQDIKASSMEGIGEGKPQLAYQKQLPRLSNNPRPWKLEAITNQPGTASTAGVVRGRLIPFHAL